MSTLQERLGKIYISDNKTTNSDGSWIQKRVSSDPYVALLKSLSKEVTVSQRRAEEILEAQEIMVAAREFILETVREDLCRVYGTNNLEAKIEHFGHSWEGLFDRYGQVMITALAELAMNRVMFVGHDGYIRKVILREKIEEIKKRGD